MQMTESEIKANIMQAKDQKAQIGICAELNDCSAEQIKEILREQGVDLRSLKGNTDGRRSNGIKSTKTETPRSDVSGALTALTARVAELIKQKRDIEDELVAIDVQLNRIEDLIAGRGVKE